jgi:uncharacterized protein YndB with AHSA1/START domain
MDKYKFTYEIEIKASPKNLYPYLSTASGLQQWFCEKAIVTPGTQLIDLMWDKDSHPAKITTQRLNKSIKFDFIPEDPENKDHNYLEFRIETSELTQSTYLKIIDYSENNDEDELKEIWDEFVHKLKLTLGS